MKLRAKKNGSGFNNSDLNLVNIVARGLNYVFELESISPYYYAMMGEKPTLKICERK